MSSEDERRPRLQTVINAALAAALHELPTMIPAKIVKWDASKQRADCQILIKNVTFDETDTRQAESWAVVPGVPVQFLGAGGFRITCPISDGTLQIDGSTISATTGSLIFSHRSMDKWLTGGGSEVDPEFDHDHGLSDAIFIPGLMPFGAPWGSCPTDHMTAGADAGVQIHFHGSTIVIGDESGAQFLALANLVKARLDTLQQAHDTHKHPTAATGPASLPDVLAGTLADVAATQAKAK